jgi:hypothetical protein
MLKRLLTGSSFWSACRAWQFRRAYAACRERYAALARERGLVYQPERVAETVQARLRARGYTPVVKKRGAVHTFAYVPSIGWHLSLLPDLHELGPVTHFDFVAHGFQPSQLHDRGSKGRTARRALQAVTLSRLREAHQRCPVDWMFVYTDGAGILADTLQQIVAETGIPTVNLSLDDKNSWECEWLGEQYAGQRTIAEPFDLTWTSSRVACEWYLVEGGRPIWLAEGFDISRFHPVASQQEFPVSFVGTAYGYRPRVIRFLKAHGVDVHAFGAGWERKGSPPDNPADIFRRSTINLGMGGIGYCENLPTLKGRDFEAPGCGGGVYLTTFNADLARHFVIGTEILCYRDREELLELVRYYLAHPEEAHAIARNGRERCMREHRWLHRYDTVCRTLGIISNTHDQVRT